MRNYSCFTYHKSDKGYIRNSNVACWLGIKSYDKGTTIYLSDFDEPETERYQDLLIKIIDQITPCRIIKREEKIFHTEITYDYERNRRATHMVLQPNPKIDRLIKFKLLGSYAQSLVLLNFIRNLWYSRPHTYSANFFKALVTIVETDPLRRLCRANQRACSTDKHLYGGDHCNVYAGLQIKSAKELLKYQGTSVREFLTSG